MTQHLIIYSYKSGKGQVSYSLHSNSISSDKCILLLLIERGLGLAVMVFKATFNNISVISWRLVLLVEETGV